MLPNNAAVGLGESDGVGGGERVAVHHRRAPSRSALKGTFTSDESGRFERRDGYRISAIAAVKPPNHITDARLSIRCISVINKKQWPRETRGPDIAY